MGGNGKKIYSGSKTSRPSCPSCPKGSDAKSVAKTGSGSKSGRNQSDRPRSNITSKSKPKPTDSPVPLWSPSVKSFLPVPSPSSNLRSEQIIHNTNIRDIFNMINDLQYEIQMNNSSPKTITSGSDTLSDSPSASAQTTQTIQTIQDVHDKIIKNNSNHLSNPSRDKSKLNASTIEKYLEAKKFLKEHNISISTITVDCKLKVSIDLDKFSKHVILKEDEIVSVKFGNRTNTTTNRAIVMIKAKKKPSKRGFYNQATILMKPMNNPSRNYMNIKVFKNGSLHMTGCKDMDDFFNVVMTLIRILKKGRNMKTSSRQTKHIDFISDEDGASMGIHNVKIRMINSNFKLDFKIDKNKLAHIIKKRHRKGTKDMEFGYIECIYKPTGGHSCVNIKYQYDELYRPSIFVFQTGSIIITGAKNLHHIIMSYNFILRLLQRYYEEIKIIDLDKKAVQNELAKYFRNRKQQQQVNKMTSINKPTILPERRRPIPTDGQSARKIVYL